MPSVPNWWRCATTDPRHWLRAVARTGARGFASLTELLAASDADIVTLATPSGLHPQQAIEVAQAGRHVLTEKPMATKWDEGMAMVRACRDARVKLFVVKQNRLNATMQLLKQAVDGGRFGRIVMVNVNVFWTRPQSYYDDAPLAWSLGSRRRRVHEPGQPLRRHGRLAGRPGRQRARLHRHAGPRHRGRGHRGDEPAPALGRAGIDQRHDAHAPQELRGQHHDPRRARHGAHRRRRRQRDPALAVRRGAARGRSGDERQLRRAVGLRPRPPAVLRQRHRHAARPGPRRSRRLRGPAFARGA